MRSASHQDEAPYLLCRFYLDSFKDLARRLDRQYPSIRHSSPTVEYDLEGTLSSLEEYHGEELADLFKDDVELSVEFHRACASKLLDLGWIAKRAEDAFTIAVRNSNTRSLVEKEIFGQSAKHIIYIEDCRTQSYLDCTVEEFYYEGFNHRWSRSVRNYGPFNG